MGELKLRMDIEIFNTKISLLRRKLNIELRKKMAKCYI
jgi:hypothetical protein